MTPPGGTEPVCFPEVVDGSFVPLDPEEIAKEFCGHPEADPATCCDPDNHEGDPNCEDLKGLFGNLNGTKRYAYLARTIDEIDNATGLYLPGGDGMPDYQYYVDRGGTLDLCDLSGANTYMDVLPGTSAHERWFGFTNAAGASKLVCVTSDGRLLDGDVSASRPMLQLQPYTKTDGTKSAWVLLAYEESKGMGHSLAAAETRGRSGDEIIGDQARGSRPGQADQAGPRQEHDLPLLRLHPARPGGARPHRQPAGPVRRALPELLRRGLRRTTNPTCTCTPGEPVPLYFDYQQCADPARPGDLRVDAGRDQVPAVPHRDRPAGALHHPVARQDGRRPRPSAPSSTSRARRARDGRRTSSSGGSSSPARATRISSRTSSARPTSTRPSPCRVAQRRR